MRIAILCPGPSLSHFDGADGYDHIVGVNRAATAFRCTTWAAGDLPMVRQWREKVIGTPLLYTAANTAAMLRDHGPPWPGAVVEFESLHDGSEQGYQWDWLTLLSAVRYAWKAGAREIRVFGADWTGESDFDGVRAGMGRTEARWAQEKQLFANIAALLKTHGVTLDRVIP